MTIFFIHELHILVVQLILLFYHINNFPPPWYLLVRSFVHLVGLGDWVIRYTRRLVQQNPSFGSLVFLCRQSHMTSSFPFQLIIALFLFSTSKLVHESS